jgi:hypothetical protein
MSEERIPLGKLFGILNYADEKDVERFIDKMTPQQALFCVVQAAKEHQEKNLFENIENGVIAKAIEILTTPIEQPTIVPPEPEIRKF